MAEACPLTVVLGVIHEGQQDSKESVGVSEKERWAEQLKDKVIDEGQPEGQFYVTCSNIHM